LFTTESLDVWISGSERDKQMFTERIVGVGASTSFFADALHAKLSLLVNVT
jgi:hypothetical protein